ncbi:MAG: hypothetical protein DRN15_06970 [Thermoprotei archaeon]|nr:MAG: hypothetical protein DRN15_06970 [Thermoprotei archaeon]RLF24148.1 MAG: hypothetical protein DRM97_03910 [Thermoprotei archaeon]
MMMNSVGGMDKNSLEERLKRVEEDISLLATEITRLRRECEELQSMFHSLMKRMDIIETRLDDDTSYLKARFYSYIMSRMRR